MLTEARRDAHRGADSTSTSDLDKPPPLDLNAIVAYNIKSIRLTRRLTQDQVADRLADFTGRRLPQASISQMEKAFDGGRRRLFNAHDLYLLAKVFEVPIVYFFLPPPPCLDRQLASTGEAVADLLETLFGAPTWLRVVDSRLVEIADTQGLGIAASEKASSCSVGSRHLHGNKLWEFDCNARLREIAKLLNELIDRHRADSDAVAPVPR